MKQLRGSEPSINDNFEMHYGRPTLETANSREEYRDREFEN